MPLTDEPYPNDEYELMILECSCDCGCLELTEDGGLCIVCRTGIHNADQE